jgi:hypothetical protein
MVFSVVLSNALVYGVIVTVKNIYIKVQKHDNSEIHKRAYESYLY